MGPRTRSSSATSGCPMGSCVPTGIITRVATRGARTTPPSLSQRRTHPPSVATTRRRQRRQLALNTATCAGRLSPTVGVRTAPSVILPRRAASPKLLALGGRAGAAAEAGVAAVALTDLRHCRRRQGLDPDPSLTTPAWVPPFRGPPCSSPLARGMHRPWMASSLFLPTWSCPPRPPSPPHSRPRARVEGGPLGWVVGPFPPIAQGDGRLAGSHGARARSRRLR